jgi:hypothetical protein
MANTLDKSQITDYILKQNSTLFAIKGVTEALHANSTNRITKSTSLDNGVEAIDVLDPIDTEALHMALRLLANNGYHNGCMLLNKVDDTLNHEILV